MSVDSNFDQVKKAFNNLGSEIGEEIDIQLDRIASLMQQYASQDAPVDTGYLSSHIEKSKTGLNSVTVTATAEYSGYVDQGTYKMAANPFFTRNVERIEREEIPKVEKNLGVKINSEFAIVRG